MKVNGYTLAPVAQDGDRPRAWRISTADAVFWLVESGTVARLARLALPPGLAHSIPRQEGEPWAALGALATTAETEAAGRWIRGGQVAPPAPSRKGVSSDQP